MTHAQFFLNKPVLWRKLRNTGRSSYKLILVAYGYVGTIGGVAVQSGLLVKVMRMNYQKRCGSCPLSSTVA